MSDEKQRLERLRTLAKKVEQWLGYALYAVESMPDGVDAAVDNAADLAQRLAEELDEATRRTP